MPARAKKKQSRPPWALPVLAVVILGGVWTAEQFARLSVSPTWLQSVFVTTPQAEGPRVGLVAGHSGNDSGAVCTNGLTEAEVNQDVTKRTAELLRRRNIAVEILEEFDTRLEGYRATAFVSIHADSCSVDYSGFKVANQEGAGEASQRLTGCLWDAYEAATGLLRHPYTITPNMTDYHAFRKIEAGTPASIIELGFLNADGALLTREPERAAKGVADGIICFLDSTPGP